MSISKRKLFIMVQMPLIIIGVVDYAPAISLVKPELSKELIGYS